MTLAGLLSDVWPLLTAREGAALLAAIDGAPDDPIGAARRWIASREANDNARRCAS